MIRWDRTDRNQRLDAVTPHSRPARVLGGDGEGVQGIAFPIRAGTGRCSQIVRARMNTIGKGTALPVVAGQRNGRHAGKSPDGPELRRKLRRVYLATLTLGGPR